MNTPAQLLQALEEGRYDQALAGLYALDGTPVSYTHLRAHET